MFYRNALQAVWLDYTTRYIIEQDINLIELFIKSIKPENANEVDDNPHTGMLNNNIN
jgi:hypothetical protein